MAATANVCSYSSLHASGCSDADPGSTALIMLGVLACSCMLCAVFHACSTHKEPSTACWYIGVTIKCTKRLGHEMSHVEVPTCDVAASLSDQQSVLGIDDLHLVESYT